MDAKLIREQAIRDAKSNLILDAARRVFSEMGFFEARLEDIATAAGFSKAALYNYYVDKEEIFLSLAIHDLEMLYTKLSSTINPNVSCLKNIEEMLCAVFNFWGKNSSLLLSVSNIQAKCSFHRDKILDKHKKLLAEVPKKFQRLLEQQTTVLKAARERGEITSDIDDLQLANYLSALVRGVIFQWQLSRKMGDVKQEVGQLLKFMANGLGCPQATS